LLLVASKGSPRHLLALAILRRARATRKRWLAGRRLRSAVQRVRARPSSGREVIYFSRNRSPHRQARRVRRSLAAPEALACARPSIFAIRCAWPSAVRGQSRPPARRCPLTIA
jgi:hypothetical protein